MSGSPITDELQRYSSLRRSGERVNTVDQVILPKLEHILTTPVLRRLFLGLSLLFVALIAFIDSKASPINVAPFYILAVFLSTATAGLRAGLLVAALCATFSGTFRALTVTPNPDFWLIGSNAIIRLSVFEACVLLLWLWQRGWRRQRDLARLDSLTGLLNRRAFFELGDRVLDSARRSGRPLSFIYLDADDFGSVNAEWGHAGGDAVLESVAAILQSAARPQDLAARMGGDEFVVIAVGADEIAAHYLSQSIQERMSQAFDTQRITFSVGVVTFHEAPPSLDHALNEADEAMYRSKRLGSLAFQSLSNRRAAPRIGVSPMPRALTSAAEPEIGV